MSRVPADGSGGVYEDPAVVELVLAVRALNEPPEMPIDPGKAQLAAAHAWQRVLEAVDNVPIAVTDWPPQPSVVITDEDADSPDA